MSYTHEKPSAGDEEKAVTGTTTAAMSSSAKPRSGSGGDVVKTVSLDLTDSDSGDLRSALGAGKDAAFLIKVDMINKEISRMGMGRFQWGLFWVSGMGWAVDNLYLQGVALVLSGVQQEFAINHVALSTLYLFVGLFLGALFWGISADILGRRFSWNLTLLFSGMFGVAAGGAQSFNGWCAVIALLGFAVGGNRESDGAFHGQGGSESRADRLGAGLFADATSYFLPYTLLPLSIAARPHPFTACFTPYRHLVHTTPGPSLGRPPSFAPVHGRSPALAPSPSCSPPPLPRPRSARRSARLAPQSPSMAPSSSNSCQPTDNSS